jgi:hypothetical protein
MNYKNKRTLIRFFTALCIVVSGLLIAHTSHSQVVIGLDNWFNRETHAKTGLPFHYLWGDSADSGFSRWGEIFVQRGAVISTLDRPLYSTLKDVNIYIIVDPDSIAEAPSPNFIMPEDVLVIARWVREGGVLVLMANDGKHCGLAHLNQLSSRFGMVFNNVMLRPVLNNQYEMGAITQFPDHPLFKNLGKIYLKEVASVTLSGNATPVLTDQGQVIMAECNFGKGYVFAVGDPWLYNEYLDHERLPGDFENRKAAENLAGYLLVKAGQGK